MYQLILQNSGVVLDTVINSINQAMLTSDFSVVWKRVNATIIHQKERNHRQNSLWPGRYNPATMKFYVFPYMVSFQQISVSILRPQYAPCIRRYIRIGRISVQTPLQSFPWYFETFWCFHKFSFHHKWNDARLLPVERLKT